MMSDGYKMVLCGALVLLALAALAICGFRPPKPPNKPVVILCLAFLVVVLTLSAAVVPQPIELLKALFIQLTGK